MIWEAGSGFPNTEQVPESKLAGHLAGSDGESLVFFTLPGLEFAAAESQRRSEHAGAGRTCRPRACSPPSRPAPGAPRARKRGLPPARARPGPRGRTITARPAGRRRGQGRQAGSRPHSRGRGSHPRQPQRLALADSASAALTMAIVSTLADAGLRRSEAAALAWADVQADADGSGRIAIPMSLT